MSIKTFQNDTDLTAEDVNDYLMEQVVAVFVDAAERDNKLPTPNPGQHCHLLSTKRTYFFDAASGWVELMPGVVSGATARTILVCTATTRPAQATGRIIHETDTKQTYISDGVTWNRIASGDTGWQTLATTTPISSRYRVVSGICYVTLIGGWASWPAAQQIATLPTFARPSSLAPIYGVSVYADVAKEINIAPDGIISINKAGSGGIACTMSFPVA